MNFSITNTWGDYPQEAKNQVFLIWDNWNDFSYFTHFGIFYVDKDSVKTDLGYIKIGFIGQQEKDRVFQQGYSFTSLGQRYFSVGDSEEYYESLNTLSPDIRDRILRGLNDIAKDENLFKLVYDEPVVQISFFRYLSPSTVIGQYRRMANGGAKLTPYSFSFYKREVNNSPISLKLFFEVMPNAFPPTNIHVLIGKNGVGKTVIIKNMMSSLLSIADSPEGDFFEFHKIPDNEEENEFANLIFVSFSAFDEIIPVTSDNLSKKKFSYIGLVDFKEDNTNRRIKSPSMFSDEFLLSLRACKARGLGERWREAVKNLNTDQHFENSEVEFLLEEKSDETILQAFHSLSSGHKIVILTITKLIEQLQEKSLVLLDEPEIHLHPPLLSALIRTISDLLLTTNGVAIIATHSPVVLQEVPKSCVWKLRRSNALMVAERLERESFGENVGVLTNEVFGLEVTESGFYKMIVEKIKNEALDYNGVIGLFSNQLGTEARLVTMATLANKN